jgi:hypothetical protein
MYENTEQQCIIPVTWERDAIYIDFRPLTTKEAIEYVTNHPMEDKEWKMGPQSTDRPHKIRKTIQQTIDDTTSQDKETPTSELATTMIDDEQPCW